MARPVSGAEIIYDGTAALERAHRTIPRVEAEMITNAGHLINVEKAGQLDRRVLDFLAGPKHDGERPLRGEVRPP